MSSGKRKLQNLCSCISDTDCLFLLSHNNPYHAECVYILRSSPCCNMFTCGVIVASIYFQSKCETPWIRWLRQNPGNLDLQCFFFKTDISRSIGLRVKNCGNISV